MLICAKMALTNRCLPHLFLRASCVQASHNVFFVAQVIVDFTATW